MRIEREMLRLLDERVPFALVTVVDSTGSVPRAPGAKMIVRENGSTTGSVGGGAVEYMITKEAVDILRRGGTLLKIYSLDSKIPGKQMPVGADDRRTENESIEERSPESTGAICGGTITIYIEAYRPGKRLIVAGAGHVGSAVAQLGTFLGYDVTVVDHRPEFANPERFPECHVLCGEFAEVLPQLRPDKETAVVVVTRGHTFDKEALASVLDTPAFYLGMIGSQKKVKDTFETLVAEGVSLVSIAKVHAPVGLDIGAQTPQEIALSVLAEIEKVYHHCSGKELTVAPEWTRSRSEASAG